MFQVSVAEIKSDVALSESSQLAPQNGPFIILYIHIDTCDLDR
jgi:hypothetical protein